MQRKRIGVYSRFFVTRMLNLTLQIVTFLGKRCVATYLPWWYNGSMTLPPPRSKERLKLLLGNTKEYLEGLDWDDIEALLSALAKTDGLDEQDVASIGDGAPEWLQVLERNALE